MADIIGECRDNCPTCPSIGTFNRLNYDNCAYDKKLSESTSPLMYQMSRYKYENCARCTYNGTQYAPFDLVEEESELRGIVRPATRCPTRLYNPTCQKSEMCSSTYDKDVPVVYPPNLCPVVCNNIKKMKTPGYSLQRRDFCDKPLQPNQEYPNNKQMRIQPYQPNQEYENDQMRIQPYPHQEYENNQQMRIQPLYQFNQNHDEMRKDKCLLKQAHMMQHGHY